MKNEPLNIDRGRMDAITETRRLALLNGRCKETHEGNCMYPHCSCLLMKGGCMNPETGLLYEPPSNPTHMRKMKIDIHGNETYSKVDTNTQVVEDTVVTIHGNESKRYAMKDEPNPE